MPHAAAGRRPLALLLLVLAPSPSAAEDLLQWSGFATLRAATSDEAPFAEDDVVARVQLGLDWTSASPFSAHVHLLARTDDAGARRGRVGSPEAYLEANFRSERGRRLRLRAGAFFLASSFENVDALWENPYSVSSSALNTWFGEELRPVGLDAAYYRGRLMLGATGYRGNETFGALPPARGWRLDDRWTLLGEELPVDGRVFTSLSAENDGRLGWSARAAWLGERLAVQYTRIDNRSDGLLYGRLFNWNTRFDLVGLGYTGGGWTLAAETGWGPTFLVVKDRRIVSDIRASYLLVSRRFGKARASVRVDTWDDGEASDEALTLALRLTPFGRLNAALELTSAGVERRLLLQLRYAFAGRW